MMECCRNKTTPHCDECGADLEAKSLVGLKKHLFARLASVTARLNEWVADTEADEQKRAQGIARNTDTLIQLESWVVELDKAIG